MDYVMAVDGEELPATVEEGLAGLLETFTVVEAQRGVPLLIMVDRKNGAWFTECHLRADELASRSTVDVPLDPDEQAEYRANREIVERSPEYRGMVEDAAQGRTFSNLVAEYSTAYQAKSPLKIIGGQHRLSAIEKALKEDVREIHGVKVYFGLDTEMRLDVQLISNTNVDVSPDLRDRMYETVQGPKLRDWCQDASLLGPGEDFADRWGRGGRFTVRYARTFIVNYYRGTEVEPAQFDQSDTTPAFCQGGVAAEPLWDATKSAHPGLWDDPGLLRAGREFARLRVAQRDAVLGGAETARKADFADKANSRAVMSAWAYVAGVLQGNKRRLERHYALAEAKRKDPLNASALAAGRHKTDADNYRGLGYLSDARERGRMAEVFFLQAEQGRGILKRTVDLAIAKFHTKKALLEQKRIEERYR